MVFQVPEKYKNLIEICGEQPSVSLLEKLIAQETIQKYEINGNGRIRIQPDFPAAYLQKDLNQPWVWIEPFTDLEDLDV